MLSNVLKMRFPLITSFSPPSNQISQVSSLILYHFIYEATEGVKEMLLKLFSKESGKCNCPAGKWSVLKPHCRPVGNK